MPYAVSRFLAWLSQRSEMRLEDPSKDFSVQSLLASSKTVEWTAVDCSAPAAAPEFPREADLQRCMAGSVSKCRHQQLSHVPGNTSRFPSSVGCNMPPKSYDFTQISGKYHVKVHQAFMKSCLSKKLLLMRMAASTVETFVGTTIFVPNPEKVTVANTSGCLLTLGYCSSSILQRLWPIG